MSEVKRATLLGLHEVAAAGREFFAERTERFFDACGTCGGTCFMPGDPNSKLLSDRATHSCPDCWSYAWRMREFCNKFFGTVPPRFQGCIWSQLKPSTKSVLPPDVQREHMDWLKQHPGNSVALFGPAGTGKSTWMTAQYAQACWWETTQDLALTGTVVYRMTTKALLDQFTQYAMHGSDYDDPAPKPRLSRERIEHVTKLGGSIHLFLEEVDKVNQTDARMANLFEVVDALYENMGQLVISSNLTLPQFTKQFGEIFVRRIAEMCRVIDLWEKK